MNKPRRKYAIANGGGGRSLFYLLLIVFFGAHAFLAEIGDGFFHRGVRVDSRLNHGEGKPHLEVSGRQGRDREIGECRLEGSVHGVKQSGKN